MFLTPNQLAALLADINKDPVLSILPVNGDTSQAIATAYNLPSSPVVNAWRTEVPISNIYDAITWTNYTPNDAPDITTIFTNRALVIQTKQMNLQNILQGRSTIDSSKANVRAGLRDAVILLPAGTGGAMVSAGGLGGATVLAACLRIATRAEALYATTQSTTGTITGNLLVFEGSISGTEVQIARTS